MGANGGELRESHAGQPHPHLLMSGKSDLICCNIVHQLFRSSSVSSLNMHTSVDIALIGYPSSSFPSP